MSRTSLNISGIVTDVLNCFVDEEGTVTAGTPLGELLDSLSLLGFLADLEDEVLNHTGVSISLDLTSYEGDVPPWETVASLTEYIAQEIEKHTSAST